MPSVPPLWNSGARKEAFELLEHLWREGDDTIRHRLTKIITIGPPSHLGNHSDPVERQAARDRRTFERIALLARNEQVPLTTELASAFYKIQERYPQWVLPEGEQAKFGVWWETRWGLETPYGVDDLRAMKDTDRLIRLLCSEQDRREGLLDNWRQVAGMEPDMSVAVLERLISCRDGGPLDVWERTLQGLATSKQVKPRLIELLSSAPPELLRKVEFGRGVASLLAATSSDLKERPVGAFWRLFDRALQAAETDPQNKDQPHDDRWLDTAINRSLGDLATAFLNALFTYRLKIGDGVPAEQAERLDRLVGMGRPNHRFARVIAASRLPYLFAIDPVWSRVTVIRALDWADEDEAVANWQGFLWHPRVGPELWAEIRQPFLAAFTEERLARLGEDNSRGMAQLLMLLGIESRHEDVPTEPARSAIRAMSNEMREDAVWWLWYYLSQENREDDAISQDRADVLRRDRVQPWLRRVWPHERNFRSRGLAERFALLAIATSDAFPDAVSFVKPLLVKSDANQVVPALDTSTHPVDHPAATLELLEAIVDLDAFYMTSDADNVLERIGQAQPALRNEPAFRMLETKLRLRPY